MLVFKLTIFCLFPAVQFQQSWAYANDVTLLAANANLPRFHGSGSGIYAGRLGALKVFVSQTVTTKILISKVPIERGATNLYRSPSTFNVRNSKMGTTFESGLDMTSGDDESGTVSGSFLEAMNRMGERSLASKKGLRKKSLIGYSVKFLDFSRNTSQTGKLCINGTCCHYSFEVEDNGEKYNKVCFLQCSLFLKGN